MINDNSDTELLFNFNYFNNNYADIGSAFRISGNLN